MMRRQRRVAAALVGLTVATAVLLAVSASDDFNRADGGLGANWTAFSIPNGNNSVSLGIVSNAVKEATDSGWEYAWWSAASFSADQCSQVTVSTAWAWASVSVRMAQHSGGTNNLDGYALVAGDGGLTLNRWDDGGPSLLQDYSSSISGGDVIRLEVAGTTIKAFVNGSQVGTDTTDATYGTGAAGLGTYNATAVLDDWYGGDGSGANCGGGGGPPPGACIAGSLGLLGVGCQP